MNTSLTFQDFLINIKIGEDKASNISSRYARITKAMNQYFRNTESETANSLQVGSYGRYSGIKSISDLDMLYFIPTSKWDNYNISGGQSKLLRDTKTALEKTYSSSTIKVDRCVVTVSFSDGTHIDIQPVFEIEDDDYKYPDTYGNGSWKVTKPRKEMKAMVENEPNKNKNLRRLCKMARSWKNKHGVNMGGLLIDTLVYKFLNSTDIYDTTSYAYYDEMCRDFFKYLHDCDSSQKEYGALGSNQRVRVKSSFKRKSKKAYNLAVEAISATSDKSQHNKWRDIFGNNFPKYVNEENEAKAINLSYENTEEYIDNTYSIDIRYNVEIDCEVSQKGFRDGLLREFLSRRYPLIIGKSLKFFISKIDIPHPYTVKWKVTNRGELAVKKNCVRGQITEDNGSQQRIESSNFKGGHFVECYIIKDNMVVAQDSIDVPISE